MDEAEQISRKLSPSLVRRERKESSLVRNEISCDVDDDDDDDKDDDDDDDDDGDYVEVSDG